jgi:protein-tyrosine phosphatase
MAEGLLRARLQRAGIDAHVHSAGLMEGGVPATSTAVDVLRDRGIDISAHESRQLVADMVEHADLVLGMTRRHAREAIVLEPDALPRIFTVKELVRRAGIAGKRAPDQPVAEWLAKLAAGRRHEDLLGDDPADDVADPVGQPRTVYEATASELDDWLAKLVAAVWPEAGEN